MEFSAATKREIKASFNECSKKEFPSRSLRKRKITKNGNSSPLSAWMKGAPANCKSKIFAVTNNQSYYPYYTLMAGMCALCQRIARRFQITDAQYLMLIEYVNRKYAGKCPEYIPETAMRTQVSPGALFWEIRDLVGLKNRLPLGFILSDRLTNAILLHALGVAIYESKRKA